MFQTAFRQQKAGGGMLVKPGFGGVRQGYKDKYGRETVHLINVTGNPNHSGIYRTTNLKTGSVSYRGGYTRRNKGGRKFTKSSSTIKGARADLDEALKIPKGKSMIDLQKEKGAGNLLNNKKFMDQLENAFEEVSALEKKGYGNIDNIVKKYQKKFFVKPGSKTISGSTVQKGTDNVFTKTLATEIRGYAKDLEIYNLENPQIEKAIKAYKKIKKPVRATFDKPGTLEIIAKRFGLNKDNFAGYLTKLNERNYIKIKDPSKYEKAIQDRNKKALKKFSDRYFERVLQAPKTSGKYFADAADDEVVRLQKSHLGDKLTQDVKTSNIGYAAEKINQDILTENFDLQIRKINRQLANLYKNKPPGYKQKMDVLNQQGTDLAAASKGYKKFEGIDPDSGKKFVINFSSPGQELDPGGILGEDVKLSDIDKQDKAVVKDLKKIAMKSATKTKAQVQADIDTIKKNLLELAGTITDKCAVNLPSKKDGGRMGFKLGSEDCLKIGKKGLNDGLTKGFRKGGQQLLATQILRAGSMIKDAASLRSLLGPQAMIFYAGTEGALIGYDMIAKGKSLREAVADSVINLGLGPKLKQDPRKLFVERLKNLGVSDQEIGKGLMFDRMTEDVQTLNDLLQRKFVADQKVEQAEKFSPVVLDKRKKEASDIAMDIQDIYRTGDRQNRNVLDALEFERFQKPETMKNFIEAKAQKDYLDRLVEGDRLLDAQDNILYKYGKGDYFKEKDREKIGEVFDIPPGFKFAGGGIAKLAGIDEGPPPESGPNSQGLSGLLKRGNKI
jgi:hypothetical protein